MTSESGEAQVAWGAGRPAIARPVVTVIEVPIAANEPNTAPPTNNRLSGVYAYLYAPALPVVLGVVAALLAGTSGTVPVPVVGGAPATGPCTQRGAVEAPPGPLGHGRSQGDGSGKVSRRRPRTDP